MEQDQKETSSLPLQQTDPEKILPTAHLTPRGNSWGALFGILIIIIILIIGALYFWGAQLAEKERLENEKALTQTEINR